MPGLRSVVQGNGTLNSFPAIAPGSNRALAVASGSSTQSTAVGSTTQLIRVCPTVASWLAIGSNPTVDNSGSTGVYIPANAVEYFPITGGQLIAVTSNTAGTVYICEALSV